jgi:hypothetical protein
MTPLIRPEMNQEMHQSELILHEIRELSGDLKDHVKDSRDRLMKIETRMETFDEVSPRLAALESFRWKILGGVAVISAACAYIFRHVGL